MKNKEIVYREILDKYLEDKTVKFTQLELSKKFRFSLSTVHNAIKPLREMGILSIKPRNFILTDAKKFIVYWSTIRRLDRDIVYSTYYDPGVKEIEKNVPSDAVFTAYSAYKFLYNDVPADYSEVYFYSGNLEEVKERFPEKKGPINVIVLEKDKWMNGNIVGRAQLFVDLWNMKTWQAREFLDKLEERLML